MMYMSCAIAGIYRNGSWLEDPELLDEVTCNGSSPFGLDVCAEVFPPYGYGRPPPRSFGGDDGARAHVAAVAHGVSQAYPCGPGSVLVRLDNACVSHSVVYVMSSDGTRILYETYRPEDRGLATLRGEYELRLVDDYRRADPFVVQLWMGSAATANYGHWLLDDLPRLQALVELRRLRPYATIQLLMPKADEARNLMRAQSCDAVCHSLEIENVEMVFVDGEAKVFFDELYYVSPVTLHPGLKSPDAMRFVAEHVAPEPERGSPKRLFLVRERTGRRDLANQEEIGALLQARGFTTVDPTPLPFLAQARLFRDAECVVGGLDTVMCNTVFCREGTKVGALAPEGCIEPFFWDLAAVRLHRNATCFGYTAPGSDPVWRKNYRINPHDLEAMLKELDPAPKHASALQEVDPFQIWN